MTDSLRSSRTALEMTALMAAVAARSDKKAFAQLFRYYAPRVKTYLMRQGASESHVEELVQETFLLVWRKAGMFDGGKASAGTWIFTIARNLRIDALRKTRRPEFDPADPAFVPDPQPTPDRVLEAGEASVHIHDALAQLPQDQTVVLRLAFFEDKSHSEIAAQLSLPLGTVKSRLRLALQRVRAILDEA